MTNVHKLLLSKTDDFCIRLLQSSKTQTLAHLRGKCNFDLVLGAKF